MIDKQIEIKIIDSLSPWIKDLQQVYLEAYKNDYLYAYRKPSQVRRYLKWLIKHAQGSFFVAFDSRKAIGFIVIQLDCYFKDEIIPEIHELVVHPAYQGRGIGKKLMTSALEFLKKQGFKKVALWVGEYNQHARKFYEKFSFKLVDRKSFWLRMEKILKP